MKTSTIEIGGGLILVGLYLYLKHKSTNSLNTNNYSSNPYSTNLQPPQTDIKYEPHVAVQLGATPEISISTCCCGNNPNSKISEGIKGNEKISNVLPKPKYSDFIKQFQVVATPENAICNFGPDTPSFYKIQCLNNYAIAHNSGGNVRGNIF